MSGKRWADGPEEWKIMKHTINPHIKKGTFQAVAHAAAHEPVEADAHRWAIV
jgi:hypothetical protein